jgi:DNA-binding NtrC family response regulator
MDEHNFPTDGKTANERSPRGPDAPRHIFVVEEEDDLRQLTAETLIDAGFHVDVAGDGESAWATLRHDKYDLLIVGQFLPKMSGVELLKKLHTARITLPSIMVTSILPTWEFALHPHLQAVTMLRKPYTVHQLLGLVNGVLPDLPVDRRGSAPNQRQQTPGDRDRLRP